MNKIILHPISIIIFITLLFFVKVELVMFSIVFVILHEYSHYLVAKSYGYHLNTLFLMPYGGMVRGEENWQNTDGFFIAIAGPLFNIIIVLIVMSMWWIFPAVYSYTLYIARVNLTLAVCNLLPFYPLDGARIILSLAKNKIKCLKILQILGIVGSIVMMILCIASIWYKFNITLGIFGLSLFVGSMFQAKNETYVQAVNNISLLKNCVRPVQRIELIISINSPLYKLLRSLDDKHIYTVEIVDNLCQTICILENESLEKLCAYPDKKEKIANIL